MGEQKRSVISQPGSRDRIEGLGAGRGEPRWLQSTKETGFTCWGNQRVGCSGTWNSLPWVLWAWKFPGFISMSRVWGFLFSSKPERSRGAKQGYYVVMPCISWCRGYIEGETQPAFCIHKPFTLQLPYLHIPPRPQGGGGAFIHFTWHRRDYAHLLHLS